MSCERKRVQASFHRGAVQYDQHTPVQQLVIEQLFKLLGQYQISDAEQLLDIGCGTGRLLGLIAQQYPKLDLIGLDLAEQMIAQATLRLPPNIKLMHGDAEQLPFNNQQFNKVISSSTFQWLPQLDCCFKEVKRVLKPGGNFLFSMFGAGTLFELQESWRIALEESGRNIAKQQDGTHRFHTAEQVKSSLHNAGFGELKVWEELEVISYPDVPHLLQAIKRIGAGTARPPAGGGLGWRKVLHAMAAIYLERFGNSNGVPASYNVIYAAGRR